MKTNKILATFLAVIMIIASLPLVSFAELPSGASYDYNFDDMPGVTLTPGGTERMWPKGWEPYNNSKIPTEWKEGKNYSSNKDDISFRFLNGVGVGYHAKPEDAKINIRYTGGAKIGLGGNKLKDTTVVYNTDFMLGATTTWIYPFLPVFQRQNNGGTMFPVSIAIKDGNVSVSDVIYDATTGESDVVKTVGTIKANEWHNIGAVITLSSTSGLTIDMYLDSVKVYTYKNTTNDYKNASLDSFIIPVSSTGLESQGRRYEQRNEYTYIDNFYIGDDITRVRPDFIIDKVTPSGDKLISIDSEFSVVTSHAIENALNIPNSIWLTSKDGKTVTFENIINEKTVVEKDTLTGILGEDLYHSEEYTLNVSDKLVNGSGRTLTTQTYKYKTKSMFPVTYDFTYTKSAGAASADFEFSGNESAMKLVMATYDESGAMVNCTVEDISANTKNASVSVSYANDETVKIFAVDSFATSTLVMEPIVDGEKSKSYKQKGTTVSVGEASAYQQIISVEGATDSLRGWVLTKIAPKGKEDSENIEDYLSINAIQTDDNGKFSFAGKVKEETGEYVYKAIAPDSGKSAFGKIEYTLGTGTELFSLSLEGKKCAKNGNEFYLSVKNADVSGLLAEFTASAKASVLLDGKEVISGETRINLNKNRTLKVLAETGEYQLYDVIVDVETTEDFKDKNDDFKVIDDSGSYYEEIVDVDAYEERIFKDVPKSHWAMNAIESLYEKGIVAGKGDGIFDPNALITREEFASMVARAFNFKPKNTRMIFFDVKKGAWYEDAVYALYENEVASGVADYVFGAGQTITRQDMTVILYRVIAERSVEDVRSYNGFKDEASISQYAKKAVEFMYKAGYVSGMDDGTFNPFGGTTKAMAAYMIYSILK